MHISFGLFFGFCMNIFSLSLSLFFCWVIGLEVLCKGFVCFSSKSGVLRKCCICHEARGVSVRSIGCSKDSEAHTDVKGTAFFCVAPSPTVKGQVSKCSCLGIDVALCLLIW